ncbi:MAG: Arm DNA-binding domain-containing protein, partial [Burkholderiaceae bacterium]|nr:Arm DNA-binding domain-containing protein [Burkholderiaceae bacterium]
MTLTDIALKKAKPADKPYKLSATNGLYALVHSNGSKYWRLDYRFCGKRKTLALGTYPDVGLKDARSRRDEAHKQLANGIDPGKVKRAQKAASQERMANSFEVIARRWLESRKGMVEDAQREKATARLQKDVFPWLGSQPIA